MNHAEQERLIADALAGTLDDAGIARLRVAVEEDPHMRQAWRDAVEMERLLAFHGAQCGGREVFAREVLARLDAPAPVEAGAAGAISTAVLHRIRPRWRRAPVAMAAAAALVMALVAGTAWWRRGETPVAVPFATLTAMEAARWAEAAPAFTIGQPLGGQRLALAAGFAEVRFARGAEVVLEGPAELELIDEQEAVLHHGNAAVHAPPEAVGFVLRGPETRVVDLGTRFGMKVGSGGATEVHVLEGLVRAETPDGQSRELREREALRTEASRTESIGADLLGFLTALPSRPSTPAGFLHWRFDEPDTASCDGVGAGLAGGRVAGTFKTLDPGAPPPRHVPGVFGQALFFNGEDGYVATSFPGIGGAAARTVALWVKVPDDWTETYGYALVSWGNPAQHGGVWQISVNPGDFGGPVGRLRVGTRRGYVVGTRDLRDGQWHHLAVVMYGSGEMTGAADVATHVLLYIDGELEPAAIKSAWTIATDVEAQHGARPFAIGRNITDASKRFFRGTIDELFLCDQALTQEQIQQLQRANTCDGLAR